MLPILAFSPELFHEGQLEHEHCVEGLRGVANVKRLPTILGELGRSRKRENNIFAGPLLHQRGSSEHFFGRTGFGRKNDQRVVENHTGRRFGEEIGSLEGSILNIPTPFIASSLISIVHMLHATARNYVDTIDVLRIRACAFYDIIELFYRWRQGFDHAAHSEIRFDEKVFHGVNGWCIKKGDLNDQRSIHLIVNQKHTIREPICLCCILYPIIKVDIGIGIGQILAPR